MAPSHLDHPAQRFCAPSSILHGTPLKEILGDAVIRLIGESLRNVLKTFDQKRFIREANDGLASEELSGRARKIGRAMAAQLPADFARCCPVLLASLGPELTRTEGNGLAPFFYLPHAHLIMECGLDDFTNGMLANYELTKRFTAEFSIRPFLAKYRSQALNQLNQWTEDPNVHVRRLVSEGSRPRLPWAMRLRDFQSDPKFTLPLLEKLKDDSELYVRRSVANHLADLLKDHPDPIYDRCTRWLKEVSKQRISAEVSKNRKWIIRHAVRLPAKKEVPQALALRTAAR